jgi:hypothetical protein
MEAPQTGPQLSTLNSLLFRHHKNTEPFAGNLSCIEGRHESGISALAREKIGGIG